MPISGISIGKDVTVSLDDNNGNVVTTRTKMFSSKQKTANRESIALDGQNRMLNIPTGWEGSFEFERTGPEIDNFINNLEAIYASGAPIPAVTITQTVTEQNGQLSQYQFIKCVVVYDNAGEWKGDDYVTQRLNFSGTARNVIT